MQLDACVFLFRHYHYYRFQFPLNVCVCRVPATSHMGIIIVIKTTCLPARTPPLHLENKKKKKKKKLRPFDLISLDGMYWHSV